jgi:hypothetical protein
MQHNKNNHKLTTHSARTNHLVSRCLIILTLLAINHSSPATAEPVRYNLDQAITIALENNRLRTISEKSLTIAEAQYRQAASSYWPTLSLNAGITRRDEKPFFEYPEHTINAPPFPPLTRCRRICDVHSYRARAVSDKSAS